ncbi:MAG: GIY-YIG nuclease family protein [Hyphomicrobiales bacterium]|nr:GIY-YIG nuclease family protein [Hyphomicrobiales bacterium]
MRRYFVYIVASRKNGALYTGVTNNIARRAFEHRSGMIEGFTSCYKIRRLVYIEEHSTIEGAIRREKAIKKWPRKWKIDLIEKENSEWFDLYRQLNR